MIYTTIIIISWWITLFLYMYSIKNNKITYPNINHYLINDVKKYKKRNGF